MRRLVRLIGPRSGAANGGGAVVIGADHYVTSPPSETPRDLADFQSQHGEAPRFAGNGAWFTPDGTITRSFSRTAAGQLAEGGRVDPTPPAGGAMTPLKN